MSPGEKTAEIIPAAVRIERLQNSDYDLQA